MIDDCFLCILFYLSYVYCFISFTNVFLLLLCLTWLRAQDMDTADVCSPTCGNGRVEEDLGEACDDGNVNNGDGCSKVCIHSYQHQ
jgi:cysteine-rich repeat protein